MTRARHGDMLAARMDDATIAQSTPDTPIPIRELRALQQRSDRKDLAQLGGHLLAIATTGTLYALALAHAAPWPLTLAALLAYGFTLVTMFAAMHETVHRTAFASLWLNNAAAWIAGLLSFYNSTFYRHYHGWHRRFTQIPGKDRAPRTSSSAVCSTMPRPFAPSRIPPWTRSSGSTACPRARGATWSPNAITYAGNNRTHMIRIPDSGRIELRLPHGATNPYLLQAMLIAACLDGLAHHRDPGRRCNNDLYTDPGTAGDFRKLPTNLLDALRANAELTMALGAPFVDAYSKLKEHEWHEHHAQISAWERAATLDC